MYTIPFQVSPTEFSVFVVMRDENIDRIKAYDPAEVRSEKFGLPWVHLKLKDVIIGYCTAEEEVEIKAITSPEQTVEMLKKLSRGWAYRPEAGDHDLDYTKET